MFFEQESLAEERKAAFNEKIQKKLEEVKELKKKARYGAFTPEEETIINVYCGKALREFVKTDETLAEMLKTWLEENVKKSRDRKLLGLAPREKENNETGGDKPKRSRRKKATENESIENADSENAETFGE